MLRSMVLVLVALASFGSGCAAVRSAELDAVEALDGGWTRVYPWGEVSCGHGQACAEVDVARVDVKNDGSGGPIEITLENRTKSNVAVQVSLESFDEAGRRTDLTGNHDVAIAPQDRSVLTLWKQGGPDKKLVVHLRARSS